MPRDAYLHSDSRLQNEIFASNRPMQLSRNFNVSKVKETWGCVVTWCADGQFSRCSRLRVVRRRGKRTERLTQRHVQLQLLRLFANVLPLHRLKHKISSMTLHQKTTLEVDALCRAFHGITSLFFWPQIGVMLVNLDVDCNTSGGATTGNLRAGWPVGQLLRQDHSPLTRVSLLLSSAALASDNSAVTWLKYKHQFCPVAINPSGAHERLSWDFFRNRANNSTFWIPSFIFFRPAARFENMFILIVGEIQCRVHCKRRSSEQIQRTVPVAGYIELNIAAFGWDRTLPLYLTTRVLYQRRGHPRILSHMNFFFLFVLEQGRRHFCFLLAAPLRDLFIKRNPTENCWQNMYLPYSSSLKQVGILSPDSSSIIDLRFSAACSRSRRSAGRGRGSNGSGLLMIDSPGLALMDRAPSPPPIWLMVSIPWMASRMLGDAFLLAYKQQCYSFSELIQSV